jgi:phosphoribosyl 1,2-cyclic phosphodiesterase
MWLKFYGVRGSTPSVSEANSRYGGNTACVVLEEPGEDPIIFDMGTGLRIYGVVAPADGTFSGTALVTHLHWDHVQGLPFFPPIFHPGSHLTVFAPSQEPASLGETFERLMQPPFFPVKPHELGGSIDFRGIGAQTMSVGGRTVTARPVPHVGSTLGYRVQGLDGSVAYISDHQAPRDLATVSPDVLELAHGVDVLIHDAQYTPAEFAIKATWGHCTTEYALLVAKAAQVRRLVMFHHDPTHSDTQIDRLYTDLQRAAEGTGVEVLVAHEGLVVKV